MYLSFEIFLKDYIRKWTDTQLIDFEQGNYARNYLILNVNIFHIAK